LDRFEHVLGHDANGVPAHGEQLVEAGIGLLQLEAHGGGIGGLDAVGVEAERGAPTYVFVLNLGGNGVGDVGRGELDAVAPIDAGAQLDGHFREVGVVD